MSLGKVGAIAAIGRDCSWDWWLHHHRWVAGDGDRRHGRCCCHQGAGPRLKVDGRRVADSRWGVATTSPLSSLTAGGGGCVVIVTSGLGSGHIVICH